MFQGEQVRKKNGDKWIVSSWNPRDIKLESFDIVGALQLDGKWYGVQMYHNIEK